MTSESPVLADLDPAIAAAVQALYVALAGAVVSGDYRTAKRLELDLALAVVAYGDRRVERALAVVADVLASEGA
jgi:hypothetical protein